MHGRLKQVAAVRAELETVQADVPVRGALCFVGTELPWFGGSSIADVPLIGRRGLSKLLRAPDDLQAGDREALADFLHHRFPSAGIELEVRDCDLWHEAFGRDAGRRAERGMRAYRIFRPVDEPRRVMVDGDFDDAASAERFLQVLRTQVWSDPNKAPAKIGQPRTAVIEMVESHSY